MFRLYLLMLFIHTVLGNECLRTNKKSKAICVKECRPESGCADDNKDCVCDGDCGYSCVKKNFKCDDLPIRHGRRIGDERHFNATVQFKCDDRYTMFGSSQRRCRGNGRWDGKMTRCRMVCKDPGINQNSRRDQKDNAIGFKVKKTLTYYCLPGYGTSDTLNIKCLPNKQWNSPPPICTLKSCGRLKLPGNTMVYRSRNWKNTATHPYGKRVYLKCSPGYRRLGGVGMMLCSDSGNYVAWKPITKALCRARSCGDPGTPKHGNKVGLMYTYKERVDYSCDTCYKLSGPSYRKCQINGRWSDATPTCVQAECRDPGTIVNGEAVVTTRPMYCNSVIYFKCFTGYNMKGAGQIKCTSNGKWSDNKPSCEIVNCGDPGSPINGKTISNNGHTYNQDVLFTCNDGYVLKGSILATCQVDGKWSKNVPICLEKCSDPSLKTTARLFGSRFYHGKKVSFGCSRTHVLEPRQSTTLTCNHGKWDKKIPLCKAPCKRLSSIQNGHLQRYYRKHGSSASFSCSRGYKMTGKSRITCNDGEWTDSVPKCSAICTRITRLQNGLVTGRGYMENDELNFKCKIDYVLEGDKKMTCQSDRRWSSRIPQCKAPCQKQLVPDNGKITQNGFKHNARVNFKCNQHYVMEGDSLLTCSDGSWSTSTPRCLAPCDKFDQQPFYKGYVKSDGFKHNEDVTFGCHDNYVIDGQATLRCSYGKWNHKKPSCGAPCIRLQAPKNGRIVQNGFQHKEEIKFKCDKGYILEGVAQQLCNSGVWSENHKSTTCKVINCGDPGSPINGKTIADDGYTYDKYVSFSCDDDYIMEGSIRAKCESDEKWSDDPPKCIAPCSRLQAPKNGKILQNGFKHNEEISFKCDEGYKLEGVSQRICNSPVWSENHINTTCKGVSNDSLTTAPYSGSVPTTRVHSTEIPSTNVFSTRVTTTAQPIHLAPCKGLSSWIRNGGYLGSYTTTHGSIASFYCRRGYKLTGSSIITCHNGAWSDSVPKCLVINCGNPGNPINGRRSTAPGYTYGRYVNFACNSGHTMTGIYWSKCQENGKWSNLPKCLVINCDDPGTPINGKTIAKDGYTYRKYVSFSCYSGYIMKGSDSAQCRSDGKWSRNLPKCVAAGCPLLPLVLQNGYIRQFDSSKYGKKVEFSCENGYTLIGSSTITCSYNTWSDSVPKCLAPCKVITRPKNGKVKYDQPNTNHGTIVEFTCHQNYYLQGEITLTCNDGSWNYNTPTCLIK